MQKQPNSNAQRIDGIIETELIKEVYARFGLAYYQSECAHKSICSIYALCTFRESMDITAPRVEEKYVQAFSLTFGRLIESIQNVIPTELFATLEIAVVKRNHLAHHFWYDRAHLMFGNSGLQEMLKELVDLAEFFESLDESVDKFLIPRFRTLGITQEMQERVFEELATGKRDEEPFLKQRKVRREERLVKVWEVPIVDEDSTSTLIFETEDGCLWQLSDVGLGWTKFTKAESNWHESEKVKPFLPSNVNPRPQLIEPWKYEFTLLKKKVLWVSRGKKDKSFQWGIKDA